ncbi:hypothetical protein BD779DRAFT_1473445 [Infundibulicybe gibba]|nr:hypothetical protein BD779DRAFT_1473445 [Infundibulicybe gibba]
MCIAAVKATYPKWHNYESRSDLPIWEFQDPGYMLEFGDQQSKTDLALLNDRTQNDHPDQGFIHPANHRTSLHDDPRVIGADPSIEIFKAPVEDHEIAQIIDSPNIVTLIRMILSASSDGKSFYFTTNDVIYDSEEVTHFGFSPASLVFPRPGWLENIALQEVPSDIATRKKGSNVSPGIFNYTSLTKASSTTL